MILILMHVVNVHHTQHGPLMVDMWGFPTGKTQPEDTGLLYMQVAYSQSTAVQAKNYRNDRAHKVESTMEGGGIVLRESPRRVLPGIAHLSPLKTGQKPLNEHQQDFVK